MTLFEEALYALGLLLLVEGILYALFPDQLRRMIVQILAVPSGQLRNIGLIVAACGLGLVWLLRS